MTVNRNVLCSMFKLGHVLSIFELNFGCKCAFERNKISTSFVCTEECVHTISVSSSHSNHAQAILVKYKTGDVIHLSSVTHSDSFYGETMVHVICSLCLKETRWLTNYELLAGKKKFHIYMHVYTFSMLLYFYLEIVFYTRSM